MILCADLAKQRNVAPFSVRMQEQRNVALFSLTMQEQQNVAPFSIGMQEQRNVAPFSLRMQEQRNVAPCWLSIVRESPGFGAKSQKMGKNYPTLLALYVYRLTDAETRAENSHACEPLIYLLYDRDVEERIVVFYSPSEHFDGQ